MLRSFVSSCVALVASGTAALAQCGYINFEELPANTPVTTQYPGITFSAPSPGGLNVPPRIFIVGANTSSPSAALRPLGDGLNEFSCDFLRMDFDSPQRLVTFSVGRTVGCSVTDTCRVRWYTASNALLGFRDVLVSGAASTARCNTYVRVGSADGDANIGRIEVEYGVSPGCACAFELIDDIMYDTDSTPPLGAMTLPADRGCVCADTVVQVRGSVDDPDGVYDNDRLEYSRDNDGPWTLVGSASTPAPGPNSLLYNWNTAGLSGWYHLRLTVTNSCGLQTVVENEVFVDTTAPSVELRAPSASAVVGGLVCFDGTVTDACSLDTYTLTYRSAAGGVYAPVDSATPSYHSGVINDPLGSWRTDSGASAVPDGSYSVRVVAVDGCSDATTVTRLVSVDNTAPVALITSPSNCTRSDQGIIQIRGTASDANMSGWAVQYTGGDAHGWVTIATGTSNIINGVLASWDARALRDCCYTIRLVVTDGVNMNCSGSGHRSEYTVSLDLGAACTQDYNGDGAVNSQDYFDFLTVFFGGCP